MDILNITTDQIKHVAHLARLHLTEEDASRLTVDMDNVLKMANAIGKLDTEDVKPMTHAVAVTNVFREDICAPSYERDIILNNAKGRDDTSFVVPQVVE